MKLKFKQITEDDDGKWCLALFEVAFDTHVGEAEYARHEIVEHMMAQPDAVTMTELRRSIKALDAKAHDTL